MTAALAVVNHGTAESPLYISHYRPRPLSEIWERVIEKRIEHEPNTGCWLWKGTVNGGGGYALVKINERDVLVTRIALALFKGADLQCGDWLACHTCDVKGCVNPDHLYVGTQSTNMADIYKPGKKQIQYRTHCARGHEFTPENTGMHAIRGRARLKKSCKICRSEAQRAYTARRRAA